MQHKRLVLKIKITKNNVKFILYSYLTHKILYKISTRYRGVQTKNKISPFSLFSMCSELCSYLRRKTPKLLYLVFAGLQKNRTLIFTFLNNKLDRKFILCCSDFSQPAHNGCRGVHLRRK